MSEHDVSDLVMQGRDVWNMPYVTVDGSIDVDAILKHVVDPGKIKTWHSATDEQCSLEDYDKNNQLSWFMPDEYREVDIAQHVIDLAENDAELQRLAQELLLFQERDLFDLLRYLRYLVAVMRENGVIWGVGRGSSVASFVLYKLGVHRINSLYYDLDPEEFLR